MALVDDLLETKKHEYLGLVESTLLFFKMQLLGFTSESIKLQWGPRIVMSINKFGKHQDKYVKCLAFFVLMIILLIIVP